MIIYMSNTYQHDMQASHSISASSIHHTLYRVSAGLDSLVVGEGQILCQVKKAYELGIQPCGSAGKVLSRLLNTAVSAGKCIIHHIPYTIHHIPYTIYHIPYTIYHTPYTIYHTPYTIYHIPYTIYHIP
ncbi:hypothetical protein EON63_08590, partial [archaeon]